MNKIKLMMAVLLAALAGYSATLIDVNFESDTVGQRPVGTGGPAGTGVQFTSTDTAVNHALVIGSAENAAGTGKGVEWVDESTSVGTKYEYTFPGQGAIRWDFSVFPLRTDGGTANQIQAAVANASGAGSSANRFATLRILGDGTARFYIGAAPAGVGSTVNLALVPNKVSMFVNDSAEALTYTDPNGVEGNPLPADYAECWINGVKLGGGALQTTVSGGTAGLVLAGFAATTAHTGLKIAIDDIKVTQILPPPTPGSLSLYFVGE